MGRPAGSAARLSGWPDQQLATIANDVAHEAPQRGLVSRWDRSFRRSNQRDTGERGRSRQRLETCGDAEVTVSLRVGNGAGSDHNTPSTRKDGMT